MTITHSIDHALVVGENSLHADLSEIVVTFWAEIEPPEAETPPSFSSGGDPAFPGGAILVSANFCTNLPVPDGNVINDMSWLLTVLPPSTLDSITARIFDNWSLTSH